MLHSGKTARSARPDGAHRHGKRKLPAWHPHTSRPRPQAQRGRSSCAPASACYLSVHVELTTFSSPLGGATKPAGADGGVQMSTPPPHLHPGSVTPDMWRSWFMTSQHPPPTDGQPHRSRICVLLPGGAAQSLRKRRVSPPQMWRHGPHRGPVSLPVLPEAVGASPLTPPPSPRGLFRGRQQAPPGRGSRSPALQPRRCSPSLSPPTRGWPR